MSTSSWPTHEWVAMPGHHHYRWDILVCPLVASRETNPIHQAWCTSIPEQKLVQVQLDDSMGPKKCYKSKNKNVLMAKDSWKVCIMHVRSSFSLPGEQDHLKWVIDCQGNDIVLRISLPYSTIAQVVRAAPWRQETANPLEREGFQKYSKIQTDVQGIKRKSHWHWHVIQSAVWRNSPPWMLSAHRFRASPSLYGEGCSSWLNKWSKQHRKSSPTQSWNVLEPKCSLWMDDGWWTDRAMEEFVFVTIYQSNHIYHISISNQKSNIIGISEVVQIAIIMNSYSKISYFNFKFIIRMIMQCIMHAAHESSIDSWYYNVIMMIMWWYVGPEPEKTQITKSNKTMLANHPNA